MVSPDAKYYAAFINAWQTVGSAEQDGWFAMRKPEILGAYKDMQTNKIINPQQQAAQPTKNE